MTDEIEIPSPLEPFRKARRPALFIGVAVLIVCLLGALPESGHQPFFSAYLLAYLFWLGIALGSLALVFLHHLVGGTWGLAIRRPAEAAAMTLPLLLIMFIPILVGAHYLYPWATERIVLTNPILQHQSPLLNLPIAGSITVVMFVCWIVLAFWIVRWGLKYDRTDSRHLARRMRKLCAFGLCFHVLTVTMLGILWVMSREAGWYSSILGFMILVGQALSAIVFLIIILRILSRVGPMHDFITPQILNDLANLVLTLTILWAYMSFAQLLIVWMGNTAVDSPWYVRRGLGQQPNAWKIVALLLVVVHFFIPFFLLLLRWTKRQFDRLTKLSILILVLRLVDVYWLANPTSLRPMHFGLSLSWMDFVMPIGIGAIWFSVFCWMLDGLPMLPHLEPADIDDDRELESGHGEAHATGAGH